VAALRRGGTAIVPAQAPALAPFLDRRDVAFVRFGEGGDVALRAFEATDEGSRVEVDVDRERVVLDFPFTARHQAENALAALAAYRALGLPLDGVGTGASDVALSPWRGEEIPLPGDGLLINDAYNANPVSMRAALAHLAERAGARRRVAVLGDMAELGPDTPAYHREVGRIAAAKGVDALIAVGSLARGYLEGASGVPLLRHAASPEEGLAELGALLEPGDCVLVKGSRALGLELVAEGLSTVKA
jgi:UDP-N-acetylmuramoyl-tripeptide--D-alanyl-D-alanine ligase